MCEFCEKFDFGRVRHYEDDVVAMIQDAGDDYSFPLFEQFSFCPVCGRHREEVDDAVEELWDTFEDIPMNPETECMEEKFLYFPIGTHREEIWKWFDRHHSRGVYYLLMERAK